VRCIKPESSLRAKRSNPVFAAAGLLRFARNDGYGPKLPLDKLHLISDTSVMTEITESMGRMPAAIERFILHWGEMGGQWGVNRSVSQIHALLYLSEKPLTAEDIAEALNMARSNVSNSLKELMGWKLIRRAPILGDRRDHFEAETDLWEMVTRIAAGRKEREIDPAVAALRQCQRDAEGDPRLNKVSRERIAAMLGFIETLDDWYGQMVKVPSNRLMGLIKLGARIVAFLPGGKSKGD
jgi:DNA-binding transcriptional regulator GbsR (MarR family)